MPKPIKLGRKDRMTFSKISEVAEMPNLIQIQTDSYDWFIKEGLGEVLKDISPIEDYSGNLVLEFFDYYMEDKTKYSVEEAKERDATGIKNLKIKYNKIFGYYFEVTNSFKHMVPEDYIRKQTLANAERYTTPKLKEMEDTILNAEDKLFALE